MKLTIYHFGDSHWIPQNMGGIKLDALHVPSEEQREIFERQTDALQEVNFKEHAGNGTDDKAILVHTGDFANFYPKEYDGCLHIPIEAQFENIRINHIQKLDHIFDFVTCKIAVPGNHDLDKKIGKEPDLEKKFKHFREALPGWHIPFSPHAPHSCNVVRISRKAEHPGSIAIFLFNSAMHTWAKEVTTKIEMEVEGGSEKTKQKVFFEQKETVPSAFVDLNNNRELLKDSDYLRIAVLHHNILPQYGNKESLVRKDIFINNGAFNEYLVKNNFKLVLSGHQHIDNHLFFSVSAGKVLPLIESSVLSLTAPSLLKQEMGIAAGFNVIEITIPNVPKQIVPNEKNSNLAFLKLTQYVCSRSSQRYMAVRPIEYTILLPRIQNVMKSEEEQHKRIDLMSRAIDCLYTESFDVDSLEKLLKPKSSTNHFTRVSDALEASRDCAANNIFGMYSVAILPPDTWLDHKGMFEQLLKEHMIRAKAFARSDGSPIKGDVYFRFSHPLYDAIERAKRNAGVLEVAKHLQNSNVRFMSDFKIPKRIVEGRSGRSLSVWGDDKLEFDKNDLKRIPRKFDLDDQIAYDDQPFELVRILIWPREYFKRFRQDTIAYINLHEEHNVPLFWLDAANVTVNNGKTIRGRYGYLILHAHKFTTDPDYKKKPVPQSSPQIYINDVTGESLESLSTPLFGIDQQEENVRQVLNEFTELLKCPELVFAIDAFAMADLNQLDRIQSLSTREIG